MDYLTVSGKEILILRAEIANPENAVYSERTDKQLVDLTLAGDEVAFECIFERHKRRIAFVAGRFFKDPAEIEEVIQICFTKAYFEFKNFHGLYDFSLASWLKRIAANICLNKLKNRTTKIENLTGALSDHEIEVFAADLKEKSAEELVVQRDLLEKLLASLSVHDRFILQMLHAEEMTVAEIAKAIGWSRAKVKVRAFRARRSLARVLKRLL